MRVRHVQVNPVGRSGRIRPLAQMLLPLLGLLGLPAAAMAGGGSTAHGSVYTTRNADDLLAAARAARPLDKYVDPKALPRDRLLRNNALPSGAAAPKAGASSGSSDGEHKDQGNDTGSGAYGTFSPL